MLKHLFCAFALFIPLAFAVAQQPAVKPAATEVATAGINPKVRLHTSQGDITVELYPEKAPKTVGNFLQYVKDGFYEGTVFHRVIPNFMAQGGGWTKDLQRKRPRAPIHNEANNGLSNLRGTLAMARTGDPHSATAEFFIKAIETGPQGPFQSDVPKTPVVIEKANVVQ